jgi:Mg2+/Co2+ transporter CorB
VLQEIAGCLGPLPQNGPKTLGGLILEHLEAIAEPDTSMLCWLDIQSKC